VSEEERLTADPRFVEAVRLFNAGEWYPCHDGFEELWHETQGPARPVLQGILQIAVARIHLDRGNRHGATVLLGEGLGRLSRCGAVALGLDLEQLRQPALQLLQGLQQPPDPAQPAGLPEELRLLPMRLEPAAEATG
jgi:predicted metal-dependent hydrolase